MRKLNLMTDEEVTQGKKSSGTTVFRGTFTVLWINMCKRQWWVQVGPLRTRGSTASVGNLYRERQTPLASNSKHPAPRLTCVLLCHQPPTPDLWYRGTWDKTDRKSPYAESNPTRVIQNSFCPLLGCLSLAVLSLHHTSSSGRRDQTLNKKMFCVVCEEDRWQQQLETFAK